MTEDEAKTKMCCGPWAVYAARNGDYDRCRASACMAWRWRGYYAEDGKFVKRVAEGHYDETRAEGHCGLAGQP